MKGLDPGDTISLFTWGLEECLVDNWGCSESEALPPGRYRLSGTFRATPAGTPARVAGTITIVEPNEE
jgi:hypothetical protein